jgi:hypothetical protein
MTPPLFTDRAGSSITLCTCIPGLPVHLRARAQLAGGLTIHEQPGPHPAANCIHPGR